MKISETFSGTYLKAAGFTSPRSFVIESVTKVTFDESPKPVVQLQGENQRLVLNKTNAFTLANAYGDDTALWSGKHIQVFAVPTFFQGKQVKGLCVQPLTSPGNANGQILSAPPSPPPVPQPAVQQLPPSHILPSQPSTPNSEPPVQAPRLDYDE